MRAVVVAILLPLLAAAEPGPPPREVRFDQDGDMLPPGAVARIGSRRFRDPGAERLFVDESGKVVSCFDRSAVRWWDLETGRYLRGWAAPVRKDVWFSADGRRAALASDNRLFVWDCWNDVEVRVLTTDGVQPIGNAAFAPDGRSLAVAERDGSSKQYSLAIWELATGRKVGIGNAADYPRSMAFADGGRLLIDESQDYAITGWDLRQKDARWRIELASHLRVDRSGRRFLAADARDERIGVYDAATAQALAGVIQLPEDNGPRVFDISELSPDGHTVLMQEQLTWDLFKSHNENAERKLNERDRHYRTATFTADERRVVAFVGQRLHVFDAATRRRLTPDLPGWGQPHKLERLRWSADGRRVLTQAPNVWDPSTSEILAWGATTGRLIGRATDRELRDAARVQARWNILERTSADRKLPIPRDTAGRRFVEPQGMIASADGALVACGRRPDEIAIFERGVEPVSLDCRWGPGLFQMGYPTVIEVATGRALLTLPAKNVGHIEFSPNGRSLAVIRPDGVPCTTS
ncbi:MAG TPA: hypothetical protein VKD90_16295 [Gemmataceae bacterium]|nr:hypothetical protein [Gemmataceae bacterium]